MSKIQKEIQTDIFFNGPVQAIFRVYSDFFMYKSGVYERFEIFEFDNVDAYHAVKILGWGTEDDIPYWVRTYRIVKNYSY